MKKSYFKRGTSALLALIMCLTAMIGFGTTTAFAAGEESEVAMFTFPRDGDANYGADWGHEAKHYMNGWTAGNVNGNTVYSVGSWDGNACYCIEPGTPLAIGDRLVQKDESYWDNFPSEYNHTIDGDTMKLHIGRILEYGYTGTVTSSWRSQNSEDANKLSYVIATQILVWETVVGERDANFGHVDPGSNDAVLSIIGANHPLRSQIMSYYNRIVDSVQKHTKIPSFCTKSPATAQSVELEWNGTNYSTTLTDTNGVLGNYTFKASASGVVCTVSGNKLTITAETAPNGPVTITASKNNSQRRGVIVWDDGKYQPGVGIQNLTTFAQEVNDPVQGFVKIDVSYGSAKIVKTSEDGKVAGITFTITGNGVNQTVKTNNNGVFQIDNLMPGTYTVTEQTNNQYEPQESRKVTVVSGQTATVTFNNTLKRGGLKVIKSSEDNFNEGVTFHLFGTSLSGISVDEYAVTDKNGVATFEDVLISGTSPYTLEEVDTAERYVVPEDQAAPVLWNEVTTRNFDNILKKFTVTVTKKDSETGTPQGDATLGGAVYGIYKDGELIDTYVTDNNGQFTTSEYVCGTGWTIKEIEPSEGYLLDGTVHDVGSDPKNYTVEHNAVAIGVGEDVIKGNVAIIKHTDNGETQIETPEEGATFQIYLKASGSYDNADPDEKDTLVCDEFGFAESKNMPYGIYTVHQVSGWEGRELMKDFDVYICKDGETYRYLINNRNFESYLKVVKVDAETGNVIPYAGAGFQIYRPDGELVTMTFTYPSPVEIDTFYTDEDGCFVTPERLEYGTGYYLIEVMAPSGYTLDSTPVYFDVTEDNSSEEGGVTVITVEKTNMAQKGTIEVSKSGEVFFGVNVTGGVDENGNELPIIYQPVYEVRGLSGATYSIRAAEDVITPDGTVRYAKGEIVDTIKTDEDGIAVSKELYLGKYEVEEIEAPYGMVLSGEVHAVELTYAGQNVEVTETATSFYNERQRVAITLAKILETDKLFGIGTNGEIKNISFGLYAANELVSSSGTSIPADGLIEIITLDENGNGYVKTDLPIGSYYVQEIATDAHYLLNNTMYPVVFDYEGQTTATVELEVNDGKPIDNYLIYGSVHGKKLDENGEALGGALIGLFKTTDTDFTAEDALMTTTSAEDGSFSFENIPYGTWYVREIEQPTGFVLDDTVFPVEISENDTVIEIEIVNEYIHGNITLTKVDAEYPDNKLTGATFEVYKDSNGDGKLDESDELLGTLEETDVGIYEMKDLFYGRYFVKETKAPEGFLLDDGVYEVFIDTDDMTYEVENKAGVGFINEAMRGSLKIVKTSTDGVVKGFAFKITGADGFSIVLETDEKGEILIEGLRIGEYTVTEVANAASAPYVLPADKTAVVQLGSTTIVEMHNVLRDTPKTGDDSNINLWYALAGVAALGLIGTGIVCFKKKKKEDKN